MKHIFFIFSLLIFLCFSCDSKSFEQENIEGGRINDSVNRALELNEVNKTVVFPVNPCDYITRKMIFTRFDVGIDDLELKEEITHHRVNSNDYSKCGYIWKKTNYEVLQEKFSKEMIDYIEKKQTEKTDGSAMHYAEIPELESPNNLVQIGHFKDYESISEAKLNFKNAHQVPSKEEFENWRQAFNKRLEKKEVNEHSRQVAQAMPKNIVTHIKFSKIEGVGDQAFYHHLNKSLDVRFGNISFSVFIDSELDFDTNLEIAKELANEVWKRL